MTELRGNPQLYGGSLHYRLVYVREQGTDIALRAPGPSSGAIEQTMQRRDFVQTFDLFGRPVGAQQVADASARDDDAQRDATPGQFAMQDVQQAGASTAEAPAIPICLRRSREVHRINRPRTDS